MPTNTGSSRTCRSTLISRIAPQNFSSRLTGTANTSNTGEPSDGSGRKYCCHRELVSRSSTHFSSMSSLVIWVKPLLEYLVKVKHRSVRRLEENSLKHC